MTSFEYIIIFILSWWLALFLALPFGGQADGDPAPNAYAAAPAKIHIKRKLIAATLLAIPITAVICWIVESGVLKP